MEESEMSNNVLDKEHDLNKFEDVTNSVENTDDTFFDAHETLAIERNEELKSNNADTNTSLIQSFASTCVSGLETPSTENSTLNNSLDSFSETCIKEIHQSVSSPADSESLNLTAKVSTTTTKPLNEVCISNASDSLVIREDESETQPVSEQGLC